MLICYPFVLEQNAYECINKLVPKIMCGYSMDSDAAVGCSGDASEYLGDGRKWGVGGV